MQVRFETQRYYSSNAVQQRKTNAITFEKNNISKLVDKKAPLFNKKILGCLTSALLALGVNVKYKTGNEELDDYIAGQVYNGRHRSVPMHTANITKMSEIHEKLKDYPEVLKRIHTTKDKAGKNPIYHANNEQMKEIHRVFEDDIETLAKIHLSKNKKGKIKAHNVDSEGLRIIYATFAGNPDIWAKINTTSNKKGLMPIHYASFDDVKLIIRTLKNDTKALKKMLSDSRKFDLSMREPVKTFLKDLPSYYFHGSGNGEIANPELIQKLAEKF